MMGFRDVLGHERQRALLQSAILTDRVHHAYLLVGRRGVGRRTMAFAFCRALNCERQDGDACDECSACRKIRAGIHPDVKVIGEDPGESTIKITEIREHVLRFVSLKLFEGRHRVIIIPEAERMNPSSANALLKTLEEPPPRTVFLLTTSNITALLPTIRSRCQKLQLPPVDDSTIAGHLMAERGFSEEKSVLLARLSGGSPGEALLLNEDLLTERSVFLNKLTGLLSGERNDPLHLTDELLGASDAKNTLLTHLEVFESFLRDAAVLQQAPGVPVYNPDQIEELSKLAHTLPFSILNQLLALVRELRDALRLYLSPKVALERLLLELDQVGRSLYRTTEGIKTSLI